VEEEPEQWPVDEGPDTMGCGGAGGGPCSVPVSERDLNPPASFPLTPGSWWSAASSRPGYDDPRLGAIFIDR